MRIKLITTGLTSESYLIQGIKEYEKRLKRYVSFDIQDLNAVKNAAVLSHEELRMKEGEQLLAKIEPSDYLVLLDEKGQEFDSEGFSVFLQKKMNAGVRQAVFVVGGAFGFSEAVYSRANAQVSLSRMTFSHQMVRLFFVEQLYRAYTILRGEKYHHP